MKKRNVAPELTWNSIRSASLGYGGSAGLGLLPVELFLLLFEVALAALGYGRLVRVLRRGREGRGREKAGEQRPQARSPASDCRTSGATCAPAR